MVDGAVAHTRPLRVVVEDIGEVILTPRRRVVDVAVGEGLAILQGGTAISIVRGSPKDVLFEGIPHRIGAGGVGGEGDGLPLIHDLGARRGAGLHGMIDISGIL